MKYTVVCFTFNKKEDKQGMEMGMMLRNNWVDTADSLTNLLTLLDSLGFSYGKLQDIAFKIATETVIKARSNFTIDNTSIIVHIVKH